MSHRIVCPHCQAELKTAAAPPRGKRVKCPKCQRAFTVSPRSSTSEAATPPQSKTAPARQPEVAAGHGKTALVLAIGVMLGVAGAGGVYWWMTSKEHPGETQVGKANPVVTHPEALAENQPDREQQAAHERPHDQPPSIQDDRADQPVAAEESVEQSELKLPMRLKSEGGLQCLAFAPDGSLLAVAGDGISLFELGTGKIYRKFPFPIRSDRRSAIEFAPNSLAIAAATVGQCTVWQVSDGRELATFRADESNLDPAQPLFAFSPSGTQLAVTDAAHAIHVWDLQQGREQSVLNGHKSPVQDLVFAPDGQSVVSAASDVRLWSLANPAENRVLIDGQPITRLAIAPDGKTLFTGPELMQWDISASGPATSRGKTTDRAAYAEQLRVLPDGKTLALCSWTEAVLWDVQQRQLRHSMEFPPSEGNAGLKEVVVSPDGQTLAIASETVQLWDLATGQMRTRIKEDQTGYWPEDIEFSADNDVLAVGYPDGLINLVPASSAAGGSAVAAATTILNHDSPVGNIAFNADGNFLVVELLPAVIDPQDPELRPDVEAIAQANDDQKVKLGTQADVQLRTKVYSELNEKLFRALYDKFEPKFHWGDVACVWEIGSGQERLRLKQPAWNRNEFLSAVGVAGVTSDHELGERRNPVPTTTVGGDRVAWLNRLTGMELYDVVTAEHFHIDSLAAEPLRAEPGRISGKLESWQFSPNGDVLLISFSSQMNTAGGTITNYDQYLVDLATRQTVPLQPNPHAALSAGEFCFSPDGVTFAAALSQADGTRTIKAWDVSTGREPKPPLSIAATQPRSLTISPNGQVLAFIEANGGLHLVDLITAQDLPVVVPAPVAMPTFSPDGQTLALTQKEGERQAILLIDLKIGQVRTRITDFMSGSIGELLFSPDGESLAVVSGNLDRDRQTYLKRQDAANIGSVGELKLFDVATGNLRSALGGHASEISDIAFSPDGQLLASSSWDKTVRLWDMESLSAATAIARRVVPRPPTKPILLAVAPATPPGNPTETSPEDSDLNAIGTSPTPESDAGARAGSRAAAAGASANVNSIGMEFVLVPAGEYQMGSPESDLDAEPYERPVHRVRISAAFALGKYEVTVGQFRAFVEATGHETDAERDGVGGFGYHADARLWGGPDPRYTWKNIGPPQTDNHPVVNVSWQDAKAFCSWLSTREGKTYRLPTEAEWEYACRAGTRTRFWTGDRVETLQGAENIGDASLRRAWSAAGWVADWDDGQPFTAPVGSFTANPWGLFDMHGNATEWTEDWFDEKFYEQSPVDDPVGPPTGDLPVHRGGNWYTPPAGARSAIRFALASPSDRSDGWGFRVVRVP